MLWGWRAALPVLLLAAVAVAKETEPPDVALVQASTDHFELYTDLRSDDARQVAADLELAYAILARRIFRTANDPELHATVLLLRDEVAWRYVCPKGPRSGTDDVRGFIHGGDTLPIVGASLANTHTTALRSLYHELAHLFIDEFLPFHPFWVSEGLAEYLATFEVDDGRLKLGKVPGDRSDLLRVAPLIPIADLVSLTPEDLRHESSRRVDMVYAESWALVHFLVNGADGELRPGFERYLATLSRGADARLDELLGRPLEDVGNDLRFYVKKGLYRFRELAAPDLVLTPRVGLEPLATADGAAIMALVRLRGGGDVAQPAADATHPAAFLVEAAIAARSIDPEGSLAALDRGLARYPDDPGLLLERARTLIVTGDLDRAEADLLHAMTTTPWFSAAVHERARLALTMAEPDHAVALARRAIALKASQASYYRTLAVSLAACGNFAGARDIAARALPLAASPAARMALDEVIRQCDEALAPGPSGADDEARSEVP